jgi:hypothetical protein
MAKLFLGSLDGVGVHEGRYEWLMDDVACPSPFVSPRNVWRVSPVADGSNANMRSIFSSTSGLEREDVALEVRGMSWCVWRTRLPRDAPDSTFQLMEVPLDVLPDVSPFL